VGAIFGAGAKTLKPVTLGPKHQAVKERAFEPQLQAYEAGSDHRTSGLGQRH
jgi:cellobiose transport system substrate-binding protein